MGEEAEPPRTIQTEDVRQGEIILRTRTQRLVFIAGLVGLVGLGAVLGFCGG